MVPIVPSLPCVKASQVRWDQMKIFGSDGRGTPPAPSSHAAPADRPGASGIVSDGTPGYRPAFVTRHLVRCRVLARYLTAATLFVFGAGPGLGADASASKSLP